MERILLGICLLLLADKSFAGVITVINITATSATLRWPTIDGADTYTLYTVDAFLVDGDAQPHVFTPSDDEQNFMQRTVNVCSRSGRVSAHITVSAGGKYMGRHDSIEFDLVAPEGWHLVPPPKGPFPDIVSPEKPHLVPPPKGPFPDIVPPEKPQLVPPPKGPFPDIVPSEPEPEVKEGIVVIKTNTTSATLRWPTIDGVDTYTLYTVDAMLADTGAEPHVFTPSDDEQNFMQRTVNVCSLSGKVTAYVILSAGGKYKGRHDFIGFDLDGGRRATPCDPVGPYSEGNPFQEPELPHLVPPPKGPFPDIAPPELPAVPPPESEVKKGIEVVKVTETSATIRWSIIKGAENHTLYTIDAFLADSSATPHVFHPEPGEDVSMERTISGFQPGMKLTAYVIGSTDERYIGNSDFIEFFLACKPGYVRISLSCTPAVPPMLGIPPVPPMSEERKQSFEVVNTAENYVTLRWAKIENADTYTVETIEAGLADKSADSHVFTPSDTDTAYMERVITGLPPGKKIIAYIRATADGKHVGRHKAIKFFTACQNGYKRYGSRCKQPRPAKLSGKKIKVVDTTLNSVTLRWPLVTGADTYTAYTIEAGLADKSADPHVFTPGDGDVDTMERTVTGLQAGRKMAVYVEATSGDDLRGRHKSVQFFTDCQDGYRRRGRRCVERKQHS